MSWPGVAPISPSRNVKNGCPPSSPNVASHAGLRAAQSSIPYVQLNAVVHRCWCPTPCVVTLNAVTVTASPGGCQESVAADTEDWREYFRAAERKIAIAGFHLDRLREQLTRVPQPSIAEQAHFEGVIIAFVSATEQAAGAIHVAQGGKGNAPALSVLLSQMSASDTTKELKTWDEAPIVRDVRNVRNRAAHRYYKKVGTGDTAQVQNPSAGNSYDGPRELVPYCSAVVSHLECLMPLLADLEAELAGRTSLPNLGLPSTATG